MSDITTYTYPSVFAMGANDGGSYLGIKEFTKDGDPYINSAGSYRDAFHFSSHPQTDPTTRPLIIDLAQYNNGTELRLEYFTETHLQENPPYITVTGKTVLVDSRTKETLVFPAGSVIQAERPFSLNARMRAGQSIDDFEAMPVWYIASLTNYSQIGQDTHVGDPAQSIYPFGEFITTNDPSNHPLTVMLPECKSAQLSPLYYSFGSVNNASLTSEEDIEDFVDDITNAGNGKNPVKPPIEPSDKPFENDPSGTGGGYGSYHGKGDTTGKPGLPTSNVLSTGFIAMYNPSLANLQSLGAKLWTTDFEETFLKLWNDPMEAIISLALMPFSPTTGGSTVCYIGNYNTEISMPRVTSQYEHFSCGSVTIDEYWGNALDYGPYTAAEIFLPFVGMRSLDIDDIMGKTVEVDYNVDLLGGESVAYITVDNRVLYDFRCNLQTNVPISSSSFANLYSGILRAATGIAVGTAAGGIGGAAAGGLTSAINIVTSKHSEVERGSELTPNAGVLGILTPYIILHRPVQSLPSNFGHFKGYPSNITSTLSSVSGYTEVSYIHLDGISATDAEKEEIYALLKAGVIL